MQEAFFAGRGGDFSKIDIAWGLDGALPSLVKRSVASTLLSSPLLDFDRTGFDMWDPSKNRGKVVRCLFVAYGCMKR